MTNFERIKRFTLDQMWQFLVYYAEGDVDTAMGFCDLCIADAKEKGKSTDCDGCIKQWLEMDEDRPQGLGYDVGRPWNCMMDDLSKPKPEWISVEKRLPDKRGKYLVYGHLPVSRLNVFEIALYENDGKWWTAARTEIITHWMPLPEPPKEVSE